MPLNTYIPSFSTPLIWPLQHPLFWTRKIIFHIYVLVQLWTPTGFLHQLIIVYCISFIYCSALWKLIYLLTFLLSIFCATSLVCIWTCLQCTYTLRMCLIVPQLLRSPLSNTNACCASWASDVNFSTELGLSRLKIIVSL